MSIGTGSPFEAMVTRENPAVPKHKRAKYVIGYNPYGKREAKMKAEQIRKKGIRARVIPVGNDGYEIYTDGYRKDYEGKRIKTKQTAPISVEPTTKSEPKSPKPMGKTIQTEPAIKQTNKPGEYKFTNIELKRLFEIHGAFSDEIVISNDNKTVRLDSMEYTHYCLMHTNTKIPAVSGLKENAGINIENVLNYINTHKSADIFTLKLYENYFEIVGNDGSVYETDYSDGMYIGILDKEFHNIIEIPETSLINMKEFITTAVKNKTEYVDFKLAKDDKLELSTEAGYGDDERKFNQTISVKTIKREPTTVMSRYSSQHLYKLLKNVLRRGFEGDMTLSFDGQYPLKLAWNECKGEFEMEYYLAPRNIED